MYNQDKLIGLWQAKKQALYAFEATVARAVRAYEDDAGAGEEQLQRIYDGRAGGDNDKACKTLRRLQEINEELRDYGQWGDAESPTGDRRGKKRPEGYATLGAFVTFQTEHDRDALGCSMRGGP